MGLLVARSLAVYGGTVALLLALAHRFLSPLKLRTALLLALLPLVFTGKAMVTAGVYAPLDIVYAGEPFQSRRAELGIGAPRSPILSDVVSSMIPWRKAVRESVKNGRFPLWNRFVLAGEPLLAVQQAAVFHPGTWIGFLLPLAQAWTFEMTLRLFLALASAYLLFRALWCSELAALVGALAWAFSDFLVFWLGYTVGAGVAVFPLLLLGLFRLARDGDRRAVTLTVVALLLAVTAGHPETLLFVVATGGVFFLFQLGLAARPARWRAIRLVLLSGAIALGLSAVQLLPLAEALPRTWEYLLREAWYSEQPKSVVLEASLRRVVPAVAPWAAMIPGPTGTNPDLWTPASYAGALVFPFALAGLFGRNRQRWCFAALVLLGLAMWGRAPGITDAVAALPLFDLAILPYLVFAAILGVAGLAALGADRLGDGEGAPAFLTGAVLSVIAIGALALRRGVLPAGEPMLRERVVLQLAPLVAAALLVALLPRRHRARIGVVALLALLVVARRLEAGGLYPTIPARAFYPPLPLLDPIPRGEPWRMAAYGYMFIPNVAALYEVEDVRGYESMTLLPLFETFSLWSVPQPIWYNRVDDPARPFLSFLNVRYLVCPTGYSPGPGWRVLAQDRAVQLLENPNVLPRAFAPRAVRFENDTGRALELLRGIEDFGERGILEGPPGPVASGWVPNGPARVAIVGYEAQSLDLDVVSEAGAFVGTSITAWPGWKGELDARPVQAVRYNHAFLGFRVPPGRHRLTIRYRPDGFFRGLAVSGATLLGVTAVLLVRRRRIGESPRARALGDYRAPRSEDSSSETWAACDDSVTSPIAAIQSDRTS